MSTHAYTAAVAANVQTAIDAAGLSLVTVSKRAGIPRRTLHHHLKGKHPFPVIELAKIATLLGVTVASFLPALDEVAA